MAPVECEICFKGFNDSGRKPRNLPCGHVYCSNCLDQSISLGSKICSACRTSHGADSASDLPVNYYILKQVNDEPKEDKLCTKENKEIENEDNYSDNEFHSGSCLRHKTGNLYFICRTHNVQLCRECTVVDHRPGVCDVISFQNQLKENKSDLLIEANTNIYRTKETCNYLKYYVDTKANDVQMKNKQIQCLQQEAENDAKMQDEAQKTILEIQEIQLDLQSFKMELSSATNKNDITKSSKTLRDKLKSARMLVDSTDLKFQLSEVLLSESLLSEKPKHFLGIFRKKPENQLVHAYHGEGTARRSAELILKDGKLHLNALQKGIKKPPKAVLVKASYLMNLAIPQNNASTTTQQSLPLEVCQARPELFLTLATKESILGTVYISVDLNAPYAKQFLELFISSQGSTYKGVNKFEFVSNKGSQDITYGIGTKYYMTDGGKLSQYTPAVTSDDALGVNGLIKSINKKGEVCQFGMDGFAILHEDPPLFCKENYHVLGFVSSGLDILCNIAANYVESKVQPVVQKLEQFGFGQTRVVNVAQTIPPNDIGNITVKELGVIIQY